ncbi:MAG: 4-hydroxybenzoate octaprenyltransferase [Janthinobacterium lividum]
MSVAGPGSFTDIDARGWVARLPPAWRPYALLARLDRPIGVWLLFLPGLWGILLQRAPWPGTLRLALLFALGSVVMRAAGCVVNDMWDRDLDRRVARTAGRPLASGTLRMRGALVFLGILLFAGLAVLLQLRPLCWALGAGVLVLVALYPLAKRVTWWPQLVMGFTFGFGAPMGAAAAGPLGAAGLALYAAAILWDLGFDTIYGFQDIEDDAVVGVRSTSRRFARHARLFVGTSYAGALAALALAGVLAGLGPWFWAVLPLPALLLARQVAALDIANPAACLRLFRANREVGLAVALAVLAGRL